MTGEMWSITQDGVDQDGETWGVHAAVARAVGGKLCPFDVYQGPYILIGEDVTVGQTPYRVAVPGAARRLWLFAAGDVGTVYREDTETVAEYWPCSSETAAIDAAKSLLEGVGYAAAESVL